MVTLGLSDQPQAADEYPKRSGHPSKYPVSLGLGGGPLCQPGCQGAIIMGLEVRGAMMNTQGSAEGHPEHTVRATFTSPQREKIIQIAILAIRIFGTRVSGPITYQPGWGWRSEGR